MENWHRGEEDTNFLFSLFIEYFIKYIDLINKKGIKVKFIGEIYLLSQQIQDHITDAEKKTANNTKMILNIAISYGGRYEIISAIKKMILQKIDPSKIDCDLLGSYLYTAGIPDPDLIIRTGGQKRLSNFFLWQSAYSELYFCDILWPDFSNENLLEAIENYYGRVRKYGK
jgi:undecaprenyl diphosphate synthase